MHSLITYLTQTLLTLSSTDDPPRRARDPLWPYIPAMIESNVQRGQLTPSSENSAFIEQGIFQQALREAIGSTAEVAVADRWYGYLSTSIESLAGNLTNSTRNSELPLDRFSIGSSMLQQYPFDDALWPYIDALQESIALQPRNDDGSLWYYNNVANLSAYRGLSYLDGMFSYPLFALLSAARDTSISGSSSEPAAVCDDIYTQFRHLYEHCGQPSGLLAHGYDATMNHSWADPVTGASPVVWGRALAWYTLGLVNVLQSREIRTCSPIVKEQLRQLLEDVIEPQLTAVENSRQMAGARYGVWQVVDRPWKPQNFIEPSASFLTVYSLMRAAKLGFIPEERHGRLSVTELATGIYFHNFYEYVVEHDLGTVMSLAGTSDVASLRDDVVDYEYYVTRPRGADSLLGSSAFILATVEVVADAERR